MEPFRRRVLLTTHSIDQAPGAWPNGSRVRKTHSNDGDANPPGAMATVIGSWGPLPENERSSTYAYFLEWDATPGLAIVCLDDRLEVVELEKTAGEYIAAIARARIKAGLAMGHAMWLETRHEKLCDTPLVLILEGYGKTVLSVLEEELEKNTRGE